MVILRNIIAVLAVSVCLPAACQKENDLERDTTNLPKVVNQPYIIDYAGTTLNTESVNEIDGRISESVLLDLYLEPDNTDENTIFQAVVEGIADTINCTGRGWIGSFRAHQPEGFDATIYCKDHMGARVSIKVKNDVLDFAYSEDVTYEPLNVSYHW